MLYFLQPKDYCPPDTNWLRNEFNPQHWCSDCKSIKPNSKFIPFDVYLDEKPDKSALNSVFLPGIGMGRWEFLELFRDEVHKYLRLGKVYLGDGRLSEDFVTFTADRLLPIRGSKKSSYYGKCPVCKAKGYSAWYPFYVTRASLFDRPIFVPWGDDGLVLTEELMARVDKRKWKGISVFKLPVIDEPRDGVDELPKDLIIAEDISWLTDYYLMELSMRLTKQSFIFPWTPAAG